MSIYINSILSQNSELLDFLEASNIDIFSDYSDLDSIERNCILSIFDLRNAKMPLSFEEIEKMSALMHSEIMVLAIINPENRELANILNKYKIIILFNQDSLKLMAAVKLSIEYSNKFSEMIKKATNTEERKQLRKHFKKTLTDLLQKELVTLVAVSIKLK
jgi:hypothetical protein